MKRSQLRQIIRESIKELQNKKHSLNEIEECEPWSNISIMDCPRDSGGGQVVITLTRHADCSWSIETMGDCGKTKPDGPRAPSGFEMG